MSANPLIENLTICRAATGMAESQFLNKVFNILSTATRRELALERKNKTKTKTKKQVMWKFTSKEPGADLEVKFRRAKFKL